jgi:hypothetical protein
MKEADAVGMHCFPGRQRRVQPPLVQGHIGRHRRKLAALDEGVTHGHMSAPIFGQALEGIETVHGSALRLSSDLVDGAATSDTKFEDGACGRLVEEKL